MESDRNLIVLVFQKHIIALDINTEKRQNIIHHKCDITTKAGFNQFFFHFPTLIDLTHVKAVIMMDERQFPSSMDAYKFRLKLEEFCKKRGIFFYLSTEIYFAVYGAILKSKILVKEGEMIAIGFSVNSFAPVAAILIREKTCYRFFKADTTLSLIYSQEWKKEFIGNLKLEKVILQHVSVLTEATEQRTKLEELFKEYNPIILTETAECELINAAIIEKILQLMDEKSCTPYDIATPCWAKYEVRYGTKLLFKTSEATVLPLEESYIVDVDPTKNVTYTNVAENPPFVIHETKLQFFKFEKVKVNFKLDLNAFFNCKVEAVFANCVEEKTTKMAVADKPLSDEKKRNSVVAKAVVCESSTADQLKVLKKARFVFDAQNFSVILGADQKENVIKDFDGLEKSPIYISFTEKKPVVGKLAMEIYPNKPDFVVFDLIKLCSTSNPDIVNPKWGFTLSKEDDSITVTMQTLDGKRKSTTEFLLALILKNGKERIKKETGKRMEEIEIKFDGFIPNEILKKNFVEAGKLLNIGIVFV